MKEYKITFKNASSQKVKADYFEEKGYSVSFYDEPQRNENGLMAIEPKPKHIINFDEIISIIEVEENE